MAEEPCRVKLLSRLSPRPIAPGTQHIEAPVQFGVGHIAGDDDDAGLLVVLWPVAQGDGRIEKMLHAVKDKGRGDVFQMHNAFDPQKIGPAQPDQRVEPKVENLGRDRCV